MAQSLAINLKGAGKDKVKKHNAPIYVYEYKSHLPSILGTIIHIKFQAEGRA